MKLAAAVLTGDSVLNSVLTAVNRQIENWLLLLKWVITVIRSPPSQHFSSSRSADGDHIYVILSLVTRLRERACIVLFDLRVQLGAADGLRILFLLVSGSQQPFTARPGPKIRLGADRMKFGSFLQGA